MRLFLLNLNGIVAVSLCQKPIFVVSSCASSHPPSHVRPTKLPNRCPSRIVLGQPSWRLATTTIEAFVTQLGGHLGPVTFHRQRRRIRPYSVAPWAIDKATVLLQPVIRALRGDFFCLPFGGNATPFRGEKHPVHGETANARWRFESLHADNDATTLHLSLKTKTRRGRVDKKILLREPHNAIYSQHIVSGMNGLMCLGHHAMLKFPDQPGSGLVGTSPFVYGQVLPATFEHPEHGGYSCLEPGAEFESLHSVPTLSGSTADLTRYPARRGFEDLVMIVSDPNTAFSWTAVTFPEQRFVWFALKNPRVLRQTILWISNGGRHYPPWSGRHVNVLGLEEVTAFFHLGLAESARSNPLSQKGFPTSVTLDPRKPLVVPYIMAVARVPRGFDRVVEIQPSTARQSVSLHSASGKEVAAEIDLDFLDQPQ